MTILPNDKATTFRWIHLPANNMAWVEALLTKLFIEEGASDVQGFKALEKSFSHQHRGKQSHSHFMRPLCQSTPRALRPPEAEPSITKSEQPLPSIFVNGAAQIQENAAPRTPTRTSTASGEEVNELLKMSSHGNKDYSKASPKDKSKKGISKGNKSPKSGSQTPNKDQQRKNSQHRNPRPPGPAVRKEVRSIQVHYFPVKGLFGVAKCLNARFLIAYSEVRHYSFSAT
jgi:hypothetical protein